MIAIPNFHSLEEFKTEDWGPGFGPGVNPGPGFGVGGSVQFISTFRNFLKYFIIYVRYSCFLKLKVGHRLTIVNEKCVAEWKISQMSKSQNPATRAAAAVRTMR